MSSKIEKTLARQKERIAEGQYYEAHQQLRVITSRYLKATPPSNLPNYPAAISLLSSGALLLLRAGHVGSGFDLANWLVDVYKQSNTPCDAEAKGRLLTILRAFPKDEDAVKKRFVNRMIEWSASAPISASSTDTHPAGDPELHHVAGQVFAEECEVYEAERHLTLGTRDSPAAFASLEYGWYQEVGGAHEAGIFAGRGVLPLLLAGNVRGANQFLLIFTGKLSQDHPELGQSSQLISSDKDGSTEQARIYPSLPLLNFLSLLVLAVQRGSSEMLNLLKRHYASVLAEQPGTDGKNGAWDEALEKIGQMYFGVRVQKQSNPLMDMVGAMLGGGGGGMGAPAQRRAPQRTNAPPAPSLD